MKDLWKNFSNQFSLHTRFNKYSLINSLKTTLGCLIGLLLAKLFKLAQPQWVLISILIVMASQYRLGGAMMKGYARLFATAVGASLASAILFFFSSHYIIVYFILFMFITMFIYLANNSKDYSYSYALGAVTMVIIVVSTNPQLQNAFDRLFEIMLGVLIAIAVSRLVFPIHAEKILYKNISDTLTLLKEIYQHFIREDKIFSLHTTNTNLEENVIQNLAQQPTLLSEACVESYKMKKNQFKYIILLRLERRLLRSIYMLHYTLRLSLRSFHEILKMDEFKKLHNEIAITINALAKKMEQKDFVIPDFNLKMNYDAIIVKLCSNFAHYSFEEKNKIHAFLFCLKHVIFVLKKFKVNIIEICESDEYSN